MAARTKQPDPLVIVKTRLPMREVVALQRAARRDGRSIAGQVAYLIRAYLEGGSK